MLDLAVVALILCFIIGLISSALLIAALYLYQLSQQITSSSTADNSASINAKATAVGAKSACQRVNAPAKSKDVNIEATRGGENVAVDGLDDDEDDSTATTSYSSCERCSQGRIPGHLQQQKQRQQQRRRQQQLVYSSLTDTATGTVDDAGVYTCEVCGYCCAGDTQKAELSYRPLNTSSIDAELSIDNESVRFRRCRTGVGAYFFQQSNTNDKEALLGPVSSVATTLILPTEADCVYHLRFCTTNGEAHSANLTHCSDCRMVLSFELTGDKRGNDATMLFVSRLRQLQSSRNNEQMCVDEIDSWLVAILTDSAANDSLITYSGKARKIGQIARQPDQLLVLQLCLQGQQTLCLEPNSAFVDCDDQSARGDPGLLSPLSTQQMLQRQQKLKRRNRRKRRQQQGGDKEAETVGNEGNNFERRTAPWDGDSECASSATNSLQIDAKSNLTGGQSPLSMGSMRRAVRWPITQMESLMETSSSSSSSAASLHHPPSPLDDKNCKGVVSGDVAIRLEDDPPPQANLEDSAVEVQKTDARKSREQ